LSVDTEPDAALHRLRAEGIADSGAFAVGTTLTIPVHGRSAADVVAAISGIDLMTRAMTTRAPTLDDVYLRLTGDRIAA
jgi:hypothetical protein